MPLTHDQLQQFFVNFTAAKKLLIEAHSKGALIEGVVLYVQMIDGLLRQLIFMERSIRIKGTIDIPDGFAWQDDSDPKFTEKEIIKLAESEGIIDTDFANTLKELYEVRNKIVHRYIISSFKYSELIPALEKYENAFQTLYKRIEELERPDLHPLDPRQKEEMRVRIEKKF